MPEKGLKATARQVRGGELMKGVVIDRFFYAEDDAKCGESTFLIDDLIDLNVAGCAHCVLC